MIRGVFPGPECLKWARFADLVYDEAVRARAKHAPYHSAHEAYGVLAEEVDEFWEIVKQKRENRSKRHMLEELVQIAACAMMAAEALGVMPDQAPDTQAQAHNEAIDGPF